MIPGSTAGRDDFPLTRPPDDPDIRPARWRHTPAAGRPDRVIRALFERLDYIYQPSRDVAADVSHFTDQLGGRLVFAIEAMGTRVAMIELTDGPPQIVLAGHLEGDEPILVYRVQDLEVASRELQAHGADPGHTLEIPQGPVRSFVAPGGQRLAIYELTRPGVVDTFAGRRDF